MPAIGILSDVHASPQPVAEAMAVFREAGVDQVFCAGDIAGYFDELVPTIHLLQENDCHCVIGNHDQQYLDKHVDEDTTAELLYLQQLPAVITREIAGRSLYMVHAQPPDGCHGGIKLRDKHGEVIEEQKKYWADQLADFPHDVLIVGHTHQVFTGFLGDTLLINPGSTVFNHSCAILHLPAMRVELIALSGKAIEKTWNWGEYMLSLRGSGGYPGKSE